MPVDDADIAAIFEEIAYLLEIEIANRFHLLVIAVAGWLNRQQQVVIDYLIEENRVLKEQVEGQRLRFTDEQRMRLVVKAKGLGRRILDELETLVTPACSQSKSRGSNTRPIRNAVSGRRGFYLRS